MAQKSLLLISLGEIGETLATELAGSDVSLVHAGDGNRPGICAISYRDRETVQADLAKVVAEHGRPDAILLAMVGKGSLLPRALADFSDDEWSEAVDAPLRAGLFVVQAIHATIPKSPPPVFFFCTTLGFSGAAEFVALCTVTEGLRALTKVVARQWGGEGWCAHILAVSPETFSPAFRGMTLPGLSGSGGPAIGRRPTIAKDIVPLLKTYIEPPAGMLTGSTIFADGGEWMLP